MLCITRHFCVYFKFPIIIIYIIRHTKSTDLERLSTFVRINLGFINHVIHAMSHVANVIENKEKKIVVILCIHRRSQRLLVACISNIYNICMQICMYNLKTYVEVGISYRFDSNKYILKPKNIRVATGIHIEYAMSWQM